MNNIKKILQEILEEENVTGAGEVTATPKIFKKVNELNITDPTKIFTAYLSDEYDETKIYELLDNQKKSRGWWGNKEGNNNFVNIEFLFEQADPGSYEAELKSMSDLIEYCNRYKVKFNKVDDTNGELIYIQIPDKYINFVKEENINESVPPIKKGRRFTPNEFEFPEQLLKPIQFGYAKEPKLYFKIATNSKGESILMMDPLVKTALDSIERGRSSFNKEQHLSRLTQYLKERVPQQVRGLIKKYSQSGKVMPNGFMSLPLIMSKKGDTWSIINPSKDSDNINKDINVPLYELSINHPMSKEDMINKIINICSKDLDKFTLISKTFNLDLTAANVFGTTFKLRNYLKHNENQIKKVYDCVNKVNELSINNPNDTKINQPDYRYYVFSHDQHKILSGWENVSDAHDFIQEMNNSLGKLSIYTRKKLLMLGLNPNSNKAWGTDMIKESKIMQIVREALLKEASYGQFKKEVKFRTKNEMLHKGIKTVKSKLQEVDRIIEYMSRMKQELSENDEGVQYWDKTKQSISKIQEIAEMLNKKIKEL